MKSWKTYHIVDDKGDILVVIAEHESSDDSFRF